MVNRKNMEPNIKTTLSSIKNDNVYNLYEDKIIVQTGKKIKELPMPAGQPGFICFHDIYYIQDRLFAILITEGSGYDMRIEIDEEKTDFTGPLIPTY